MSLSIGLESVRSNRFAYDFVGKYMLCMFVQGIVFFSLTLAIEVRLFSTTKYRLTSWWANRFRASIDGTSDSKDEDEDVAIERKRVLEAGVSDDVLVSSAKVLPSQCHRSAYYVSSQCRSST